MSQSAAAPSHTEANTFQLYLIPPEAKNVRLLMRGAEEFSQSRDKFDAHISSVVCATLAVGLSAINAVSYFLQMPCRLLLNVARFAPADVLFDLMQGMTDLFRSLLFVSLGVTFVVAGFFFPGSIFPFFAPVPDLDPFAKLKGKIERSRDELARTRADNQNAEETILAAAALDQENVNQIEQLTNALNKKDEELEEKNAEIENRDAQLAEKDAELAEAYRLPVRLGLTAANAKIRAGAKNVKEWVYPARS